MSVLVLLSLDSGAMFYARCRHKDDLIYPWDICSHGTSNTGLTILTFLPLGYLCA